jgi:hypothetical protein
VTTAFRSLLLLLVTLTGSALFANSARAFDPRYDRLDDLASRLEAESRTLTRELRRYGYADPNLREASREVASIARDARHIHTILHTGVSLDHLHSDVLSLQDSVHHLEEHLAPYDHFEDHVVQMDALTHAIDDAIHALEHAHVTRRPVTVYRPDYGVPQNRGGVTFGNGGFSVRLGR